MEQVLANIREIRSRWDDLKIMVSDLRGAPGLFSVMEDKTTLDGEVVATVRYLDYGRLYNEKTGQVVPLRDMMTGGKSGELNNLYYLKYKIDPS